MLVVVCDKMSSTRRENGVTWGGIPNRIFIWRPCVSFSCCFISKVVINGGATSSGDQDTEDTELMAIYTTENGIAEKVRSALLLGENSVLLSQFSYLSTLVLLGWEISFLPSAMLTCRFRSGLGELCPCDSSGHIFGLQNTGSDSADVRSTLTWHQNL